MDAGEVNELCIYIKCMYICVAAAYCSFLKSCVMEVGIDSFASHLLSNSSGATLTGAHIPGITLLRPKGIAFLAPFFEKEI